MTVYVDDMRAQFGRMIMCHMIATTDDELHAMADAIGVSRRWHQRDHYDLSLTKRAAAIARGAQQITWRQCGMMTMFRRRTGAMPQSLQEAEREHWRRMALARNADELLDAMRAGGASAFADADHLSDQAE